MLHRSIGIIVRPLSVVTDRWGLKMAAKKFRVRISADECKGCGRCIPACPKALISRHEGEINVQGYVPVKVEHPEQCIGCGACFYQCPEPGAITVFEESED